MNYYEPITVKNFLSESECNYILSTNLDNYNLLPAKISGVTDGLDTGYRKSSVALIDKIDIIDDRLKSVLNDIVKVKGGNISEIGKYQFTKYDIGEHYNWHTDSGNTIFKNRVASIVIQLNNNYTGGNLEYKDDTGVIHEFERGAGNLFIFYSGLEHRVSPIESGIRYSLVNWISVNDVKKTLI